jgi:hypothetical protein
MGAAPAAACTCGSSRGRAYSSTSSRHGAAGDSAAAAPCAAAPCAAAARGAAGTRRAGRRAARRAGGAAAGAWCSSIAERSGGCLARESKRHPPEMLTVRDVRCTAHAAAYRPAPHGAYAAPARAGADGSSVCGAALPQPRARRGAAQPCCGAPARSSRLARGSRGRRCSRKGRGVTRARPQRGARRVAGGAAGRGARRTACMRNACPGADLTGACRLRSRRRTAACSS